MNLAQGNLQKGKRPSNKTIKGMSPYNKKAIINESDRLKGPGHKAASKTMLLPLLLM